MMNSVIIACVVACIALAAPAITLAKGIAEDELRALYLFNFSNFAVWPRASFAGEDSPLRYCVLGEGRVNKPLQGLIEGERVDGHPLVYRPVTHDRELDGCHILYLNREIPGGIANITRRLANAPVLTVSDHRASIDQGVMIALVRSGSRVRPVVNLPAVEKAQIRLSAKLLQLSNVIDGR